MEGEVKFPWFIIFIAIIICTLMSFFACGDDDDDTGSGDDNDETADDDDDDSSSDFGLTWVIIPGGQFVMGCSQGDGNCDETELPRHFVTIPTFEMTETLITQEQFEALTGKNPSYHGNCSECPVEQVTWFEANDFCEAVGGMLPTEARWEYAARAGTDTVTFCGDDTDCLDSIAWYLVNSGGMTHPVGQKQPNELGLFDTVGNVWEWVNDWYDEKYYNSSPKQDPGGGEYSQFRSVRGAGAYNNDTDFLRISLRNRDMDKDKNRALGFRCVR